MPRPMYNTTKLPSQLREELGLHDDNRNHKARRNDQFSRRDRRKQERTEKKNGRQPRGDFKRHGGKRPADDSDFGSESEEEATVRPQSKKAAAVQSVKSKLKPILRKAKRQEPLDDDESEEQDDEESPAPKISQGARAKLDQDDAEIAALEKRLGIKGKKKLPKAFQEDGLDDILGELADDSDSEKKKRKRESDEWLQRKRRKAQGLESSEDENSDEDLSDLLSEDDDDEGEDEDMEDGLDLLAEGESDGSDFGGFEEEDEEDDGTPPPPRTRENPYVAPMAPDASKQKYIPPSLRAAASSDTEALTRLRRQTQGLLNKLSEANMISILGDVEKLYRDNPRQNVTSVLINLLLGLFCDRTTLQDTFTILHAGFVAAIYKVMGMDFGAEFVQKIVESFDQIYEGKTGAQGKEAINLMSLLSHLYNFHVIGSGLVFDYIRMFLKQIDETNTEMLLKIIRNSGPQLRQDDPSALKDIVLLVQPAVTQIGEGALSVRTKFMIETITDLKNNRMKTGAAASSVSSEHITKMRKILGSLNNRSNLRATEPLRIDRNDVHSSSKKGKWWLVGASWKDDTQASDRVVNEVPTDDLPDEDFADEAIDMLQLAKTHRMNTDIRRAIFVAIMSATDYRDAHLRLQKLRLKRNQELEVPRVLIHCVQEEEAHNPYYTFIARRLCSDRKLKMAFQFSLWDVFRKMGERNEMDDDDDDDAGFDDAANEMSLKSIVNLAKMYGYLITDGGLNIGILKNLNFAYLQPKTTTFVELLIITIIQQTAHKKAAAKKDKKSKIDGAETDDAQEKALVQVFLKARETPQVVKGLIYFIRKVVAKTDIMSSTSEKKTLKWGCKVAVDALRISGGTAR